VNRVYIYYRVSAGAREAMRGAVTQLLRQVEARTGIRGRVARRLDDEQTWMETYEPVEDPAAFVPLLKELAHSAHVATYLDAGAARHIEVFVDKP
jgi:hypothetical protein